MKKAWLILILLLFQCLVFMPNTTGQSGIFLVKELSDYETAGFNLSNITFEPYLYSNDGLIDFYMPVALKKEDVGNLKLKDIEHTIYNGNQNFLDRLVNISFNLYESDTYWLVMYEMKVKASDKPFAIDFVPKIKGEEISKFAWWNSSYLNFRIVNINNAYITTTLESFPMLIVLDNSSGNFTFHGSGEDIAFVSLDNSTQFYHEVNAYDDVGDTFCWVNISEHIPSGSTYSFLVYYNSVTATDIHHKPLDVWDIHYKIILHMNDTTNVLVEDSTIYNNHGDKFGVDSPREINVNLSKGQYYDATGDLLNCGTDASLDITDEVTVEIYMNITDIDNPVNTYSALIRKQNAIILNLLDTGQFAALFYKTNNMRYYLVSTLATPLANNVRSFVGFTFAGVDAEFWHNLEKNGGAETPAGSGQDDNDDISIGGRIGDVTYTMNGAIDEFFYSSIKRNDSWIIARYHNFNRTDDFISFGSQQVYIPPPPPISHTLSISNEHPKNLSYVEIVPSGIMLRFNLSSTLGLEMNYTIYIGNTSIPDIKLANGSHATNGSYYAIHYDATNSTTYWWNVSVNSSFLNAWKNESYNFTLYSEVVIINTPGFEIAIFILALCVLLFWKKRSNKKC